MLPHMVGRKGEASRWKCRLCHDGALPPYMYAGRNEKPCCCADKSDGRNGRNGRDVVGILEASAELLAICVTDAVSTQTEDKIR